ncbi:glycosyltransferase family 2 protein [Candidatus Woesebacteria bacterium]|nr:glycosyltransferase family 2 protein [Candidatus Woesebacteria bacterium]
MTHVSVIIPSYNGRQLLEKNLPAVIDAIQENDEIVIVDDASSDDTLAWMQQQFSVVSQESSVKETLLYTSKFKNRLIKVLINQSNQRFAISCNRGVSIANYPILLLLNNDVVPESDFLRPLLEHFKSPEVFAVGCKEIATAEGNKAYGRAGGSFQRGFLVHFREPNQDERTTLWAAGGSAVFRKSMWDELHGFDPDYRPAYWEDIDLSWRAIQQGWKILFEPLSVVHHNHESTNASVFGKQQMEVMAYKNSILFMWKNARGLDLVSHLLWLPYHIIFTSLRSHGRFLQGLWMACKTVFGHRLTNTSRV